MNKTQELTKKNGTVKMKELNNITMEEIDEQIKLREEELQFLVGTLYPSVLHGDIAKLKIMKQYPVDTKVEGGFLYFKLGDKWEIAGRENHILTQKFLKEVKTTYYRRLYDEQNR